jgi:dihydroorotase
LISAFFGRCRTQTASGVTPVLNSGGVPGTSLFSNQSGPMIELRLARRIATAALSCGLLLLLTLVPAEAGQAQPVNILLKGGHVIDPANGVDGPMDVAIGGGRILQVAPDIPADGAQRVVDATGLYVTPGLIDMHVHVFAGADEQPFTGFGITSGMGSVQPDAFTFRSGVTTVVDAGSSGWKNFHRFRSQVVETSRTRVLALLSIAGEGMLGTVHAQHTDDMDPVATAFIINANRDVLVGIKAHHYQGPDYTPEQRAVEAGNRAGVPVMVDFGGNTPPRSLERLLMEILRPGDILTHTHFGSRTREGAIDESGRLRSFILPAQRRGIIFDVGHGAGGFQWDQAIPGVQQGFLPNTISTDLYRLSMNAGMKDLSNVMSKFLNIGLSLQDVIERTTVNPARVIQRPELGNLSVGSEADVAVFRLREGEFGFLDARGNRIPGDRKLEAELTIRGGQVVWDLNGIAAPEFNLQNFYTQGIGTDDARSRQ